MNKKLDDFVNHRIATVAGLLKRQIHRLIAEKRLAITPDQWVLLNYLWEKDGLSIGELATKSRKDFANVTRIVEKLQQQGYVTKKKNEKDGRSYIVHYTAKALQIKKSVEECQKDSHDISMEGIREEEQHTIIHILNKLEVNTLKYLEEGRD